MSWGPKYWNPITGEKFTLSLEHRQAIEAVDQHVSQNEVVKKVLAYLRRPGRKKRARVMFIVDDLMKAPDV